MASDSPPDSSHTHVCLFVSLPTYCVHMLECVCTSVCVFVLTPPMLLGSIGVSAAEQPFNVWEQVQTCHIETTIGR